MLGWTWIRSRVWMVAEEYIRILLLCECNRLRKLRFHFIVLLTLLLRWVMLSYYDCCPKKCLLDLWPTNDDHTFNMGSPYRDLSVTYRRTTHHQIAVEVAHHKKWHCRTQIDRFLSAIEISTVVDKSDGTKIGYERFQVPCWVVESLQYCNYIYRLMSQVLANAAQTPSEWQCEKKRRPLISSTRQHTARAEWRDVWRLIAKGKATIYCRSSNYKPTSKRWGWQEVQAVVVVVEIIQPTSLRCRREGEQ